MYRCYNIISIIIILLTSFILPVVVIAIDRSDGERRNTTTSTYTPDVASSSSSSSFERHEEIIKLQKERKIIIKHNNNNNNNSMMLNMTLCGGKCDNENCKSYITPINSCYSSSILFPNDISWSGKDIYDTIICQTLIRNIYDTENGTCRRQDDNDSNKFLIPLNECVGPFGLPRPWGTFRLAIRNNNDEDEEHNADISTNLLLCDDGDNTGGGDDNMSSGTRSDSDMHATIL
ncbi:MAG: hypothetical protein ACI8RD_001123 [Bacillariaceae sp.]|jgi:hypothetical protein